MRRRLALSALALLLAEAPARADEAEAEACTQAKVQEGYAQGWGVRTTSTEMLGQGERDVLALTLHTGNRYRIVACGDAHFTAVDVVVYDATGKVLAQDSDPGREPVVEVTPTATGKYFIAVFASGVTTPGIKGGVATAVTYQ
ncbi:hypothetical protein L6R53_30640 [Myxococcota bacterium]|nr:hypothetical protein [Myxococcota bacterium]